MRGLCEVIFNRGLHPVSSKISSCYEACWLILINTSKGHIVQQHTVIRNALCIRFTNLAALVAGANPQLVDLRFGHVGPLLCIIKRMLELPVFRQVGVCLLLLRRGGNQGHNLVNWRGARLFSFFFHCINHCNTSPVVNDVVKMIIYHWQYKNTKLQIVDSPLLRSVSWNSSPWPAACRWGPAAGPGSSCLPQPAQTEQGALTLLSSVKWKNIHPFCTAQHALCVSRLVVYLVGELFDSPLILP